MQLDAQRDVLLGVIAAMEAAGIVTAAQVNPHLSARFVLTVGGCRRPIYKPSKPLLIAIDHNSTY